MEAASSRALSVSKLGTPVLRWMAACTWIFAFIKSRTKSTFRKYSSASDLDEETYALLAANNVGEDEERNKNEEHIGMEHDEHYESLVVQRVLSAQMEKAEQNQHHTLFQTKCVIKEHFC